MADLALDDDLNLAIPMRLIDGPELILQRIRVRLATHAGEWLLDTNAGLPYSDWQGATPAPTREMEARILETILRVPGVTRLENFAIELNEDTGSFSITGTIIYATADPASPILVTVSPVSGAVRVRAVTN